MKYYGIGIILFLFIVQSTLAQERVSESEINLQKQFIEAHREKVLGNLDKAIELFKEIKKADRSLAAASFELSVLYEAKEEYDQALKHAREAVELEPGNVWFSRLLSTLYEKEGQYREAAVIYKDLIKDHPNVVEYYMQRALLLVKDQDIKEAVKVYDELEDIRGINEELSLRKYTLFLGVGDYKSAEKELQQLVESDPLNIRFKHKLAGFYEQIGEKASAESLYREILKINPDDGKAQAALIDESKGTGHNAIEYVNSLQPLFERPNVDIDLKIGKILPLIQQVVETQDIQLSDALLNLTGLLEKVHPDEAKVFSAAGDLLFYRGKIREAIAKYERTLELDDTVFSVWEQLMYAQLQLRDYPALGKVAKEAMDLYPNKAKAYEMYGLAETQLGNTNKAIDILNEAIFMTGKNQLLKSQVYNTLALAYQRAGQLESAQKTFEKGIAINNQSPKLLNDYSRLLAKTGAFEDALAALKNAEKYAPKSAHIEATRAYVFYKRGDLNKAKTIYERALNEGNNDDPFTLEGIGDVLFQLNETDKAVEYWKKALELDERNELLKRKVSEGKLFE